MELLENLPFSKFCSLNITDEAKFYCEVSNVDELKEILEFSKKDSLEQLIIGDGTNLVPTQPFNGVIIKNNIIGIKRLDELTLEVSSGENWDNFVKWTINNGLYGLENLALIPGTVGAGPIQNIGAYGAEISRYIQSIYCVDIKDGSHHEFNNEECDFGYRTSVFKEQKNLFILSVTFKLSKTPKLNYSYDSLREEIDFNDIKGDLLSPMDMYELVSKVRNRKLPNYIDRPNVGSFFKNIYLTKEDFLQLNLPFEIPIFQEKGLYKIPTALILQETGWKGKRMGNIGISDKHSLVLITYDKVKGSEVLSFTERVIDDVYLKTGLKLEVEPTFV